MNTSEQYKSFLSKKASDDKVTWDDVAVRVDNEDQAMLDFMAENDPIQVYALLHKSDAPMSIGKNAPFIPDFKKVDGELRLLLVKKDLTTLNDIISNYVLNLKAKNNTTNPVLLNAMEKNSSIFQNKNGDWVFKNRLI